MVLMFCVFFGGNFSYIMFYQLIKFQQQTFFTTEGIKQFVLLNSSLDTSEHHKLKELFFCNFKYDSQIKKGKRKVQKFEYLDNVLGRIKRIFHNFLTKFFLLVKSWTQAFPPKIFLLKVNKRNTRKWCEICSKLTVKTPDDVTDVVLLF